MDMVRRFGTSLLCFFCLLDPLRTLSGSGKTGRYSAADAFPVTWHYCIVIQVVFVLRFSHVFDVPEAFYVRVIPISVRPENGHSNSDLSPLLAIYQTMRGCLRRRCRGWDPALLTYNCRRSLAQTSRLRTP
ncbi:hypothetical protein BDZ89DRAFT_249283 [Hymenopellis radicata]|nr:hypothetical protein BDZ89DRAFT_249283 [Hymenopellis radicata]